jgi:hypothetical protein
MKIKILSGWSAPGGSTQHHIDLTNLLNDNGYDCTFYGPHDYHVDKCKSGMLQEAKIDPEDIVISHFLKIPDGLDVKKHILSLHETNLFPLKELNPDCYDVIQYVSEQQREWQDYDHEYVIIPPMVDEVSWEAPEEGSDRSKIAGVIGSVDSHKQPHLAVQKALEDGFERVLMFGIITDKDYFEKELLEYVENGLVVMLGQMEDKNEMYNLVGKVYHMSKRETFGLVEAECKKVGIPFEGLENNPTVLTNEEVLGLWKNLLEV